MAANYSTNPTNPVNQNGGQMPGQDPDAFAGQPMSQAPQQPRTIRDYVNLARQTGQPMSFTNKAGGQGFYVNDRPQAIPEAPASEYEKLPFGKRISMDPYDRTRARLETMLPQIWESVFPGMDSNGVILNEAQMKQWQSAVQAVTARLLKHHDKQYEWYLKDQMKSKKDDSRSEDQRFWQSKYVDAMLRGSLPIDEETGMPVTEAEFISERMSVADEMRFKAEMEGQEGQGGTLDSFEPEDISRVLGSNPGLARAVKESTMEAISQQIGRPITDQELYAMQQDPQMREMLNQASYSALQQYQEDILQMLQ